MAENTTKIFDLNRLNDISHSLKISFEEGKLGAVKHDLNRLMEYLKELGGEDGFPIKEFGSESELNNIAISLKRAFEEGSFEEIQDGMTRSFAHCMSPDQFMTKEITASISHFHSVFNKLNVEHLKEIEATINTFLFVVSKDKDYPLHPFGSKGFYYY